MARRRKSDTVDALKVVLWLLFGIPMLLFFLCKWLFSGLTKLLQKATAQPTYYNLDDIDNMDGWSFEYYVSNLLKENGFKNVHVTEGSGDFGVDITAFKANQKWVFQCKNYQEKLGVAPIQEIYSGARKYDAEVCVVVTNSFFTPHAKELADCLNVLLWDRKELEKLASTHGEGKATTFNLFQNAKEQIAEERSFFPPLGTTFSSSSTTPENRHGASKESLVQTKTLKNTIMFQEDFEMATQLGAGKYIFGVNIPEGTYNLKAISGNGSLEFKRLVDGSWEEEYMAFGVADHCAKSYHGMSLPKNKYFEVSGDVIFEISKATMLEID